MMNIRVVWMLVGQYLMAMSMCMRPFATPGGHVFVQVVLVVPVPIGVPEWLVGVLVLVALSHIERHTERHQRRSHPDQ